MSGRFLFLFLALGRKPASTFRRAARVDFSSPLQFKPHNFEEQDFPT